MGKFYKKYKIYIVILIGLMLPLFVSDDYILHLANLAGIFAILTLSLNLLTGCTGQFSVGQAAFYGIGAYTSAILTAKLGLPVFVGFIGAGIVTSLFGLLLGLPTARLKGIYLGVATMGFGEIMYQVFVNWEPVTNGAMGITGVPAPQIGPLTFDGYRSYYYIVLIVLIVVTALLYNLINSRVGRAFLAIKENEVAAEAMGIDSTKFKIIAFMCSAFLAGIAGSLYAHEVKFVSPETFVNSESSEILAMMVVGGIGSIPGSILGAAVLVIVPEVLRSVGDFRLVIYGAAVVAIIIFAPQGMGGLVSKIDEILSSIGAGKKNIKKTSKEA